MNDMNRRQFLTALGSGAATLVLDPAALSAASEEARPIRGSWFEFQHHATVEGVDWNPDLVRFTAEQWDQKIQEMADAGLEYLVLMATALDYRSFYDSQIYPKWKLACPDPLEAVLAAADRCKVKFFVGAGFYGDWRSDRAITDPLAMRQRLQSLGELVRLYGHHRSFYGWYWPDEASIDRHFSAEFIAYVNTLSREGRQLRHEAPILIAPYGTRLAVADDEYVRQLDSMDVDIVAYQDEAGVRKSKPSETPAFYEALRKAHDRAQKAKIWADVEIFAFEGEVYRSPLVPAPFGRVRRQLEAVSPFVDEILVYQYLGLMNRPGAPAFAGSPQSTRLWSDAMAWRNHRS